MARARGSPAPAWQQRVPSGLVGLDRRQVRELLTAQHVTAGVDVWLARPEVGIHGDAARPVGYARALQSKLGDVGGPTGRDGHGIADHALATIDHDDLVADAIDPLDHRP